MNSSNAEPEDSVPEATRRWWHELDDDRRGRAELRRCRNVTEVFLVPSFHTLRRAAKRIEPKCSDPGLACAAGILAGVRTDHPGSLGSVFGTPASAASSAPLSELRLRRLLQSADHDELLRSLRRAVAVIDGNAPVADLTRAAIFWNDRTKRRVAIDYYSNAPEKKDPS